MPRDDELIQAVYTEKPPRVAFKKLLAAGYVKAGQKLYLDEPKTTATITDKAKLKAGRNALGQFIASHVSSKTCRL